MLCPGVNVSFTDKVNNTQETWCYAVDGLTDYLSEAVAEFVRLPEEPFTGNLKVITKPLKWSMLWLPEGGDLLTKVM